MKAAPIIPRSGETAEALLRRHIRIMHCLSVMLFVLSICVAAAGALAQQSDRERGQRGQGGNLESLDPGPRTGFGVSGNPTFPNNPGNPINGLTGLQTTFFQNGISQFTQEETVAVTSPGNGGIGPAFNSDSCGSCHSQPATGGTSPSPNAFPMANNLVNGVPGQNPQFTVGQVAGGTNSIPFFVTADGPVREARFKSDGGVHDLFTIQGRTDVPNPPNKCTLAQPDFAAEAARDNLSFRIPLPVFGDGLVENISEATLIANLAASSSDALGIHGTLNRSGNDGSITRFGWKAQNKSLLMFAGEAYNVEMGVTNELFPNERGYPPNPLPPGCLVNQTPEDRTIYESATGVGAMSDMESFAQFMRFLDQPIPACTGTGCSPQIQRGLAVFTAIGCANCHTPSMTTALSFEATGLSQVQANLFSDLALHHMGVGLADGISQGNAGPDQFRTAPLWGIGQRVFFLHDGRTSNLYQAIIEHESQGSEANRVIENYEQLSRQDKQNLILFLRSL